MKKSGIEDISKKLCVNFSEPLVASEQFVELDHLSTEEEKANFMHALFECRKKNVPRKSQQRASINEIARELPGFLEAQYKLKKQAINDTKLTLKQRIIRNREIHTQYTKTAALSRKPHLSQMVSSSPLKSRFAAGRSRPTAAASFKLEAKPMVTYTRCTAATIKPITITQRTNAKPSEAQLYSFRTSTKQHSLKASIREDMAMSDSVTPASLFPTRPYSKADSSSLKSNKSSSQFNGFIPEDTHTQSTYNPFDSYSEL